MISIALKREGYGPKGNLIDQTGWLPANTAVVGFLKALNTAFNGGVELKFRDVDGATQDFVPYQFNLRVAAANTVKTWGIIIGTGNRATTLQDYCLQSPVTANITYPAVTTSVDTPEAGTRRLQIARTFTNGTGAAVQIEEVGLFHATYYSKILMFDRTLHSYSLANGASCTFTYGISATV